MPNRSAQDCITGGRAVLAVACSLALGNAGQSEVLRDKTERPDMAVFAVEGSVLAWVPWSAKWRPIPESGRIPNGSLVIVSEGGRLVYAPRLKDGFGDQVTLNTAVTIRLDGTEARSIKLDSQFFDNLPETRLKGDKGGGDDSVDLTKAWERTVLLFRDETQFTKAIRDSLGQESPEQKFSVALNSESLRVLDPPMQAVVAAPVLPKTITLRWETAPQTRFDQGYSVRVWREGEEPTEVGRTQGHEFRVPLNNYGRYRVQVQAIDAEGQEHVSTISVQVFPPLGEDDALTSSNVDGDRQASVRPLLVEVFPPANMTYLMERPKLAMVFTWQMRESLPPDFAHYELTLVRSNGLIERVAKVRQPFVEMDSLAPDRYRWYVKVMVRGSQGPVEQWRSHLRVLNLVQGSLPSLENRSGVYYAAGGF